ALAQAQANLDYTTVRAPVDGVVVSRAVDVGQTVAASLQAPTLFTIAQDLTKMQVETSVDEADIGRVKLEDRASFTVDAFPGQPFVGVVTQIRKAALIVQNVVTYTVVISVDNPGGRLLPGMTANVKLVYAEKPSVLKVPNAALRFRPAGADAGPVGSTRGQGGAPSAGPPAAGQPPRRDRAGVRRWRQRRARVDPRHGRQTEGGSPHARPQRRHGHGGAARRSQGRPGGHHRPRGRRPAESPRDVRQHPRRTAPEALSAVAIIATEELGKDYHLGPHTVHALRGVSVSIEPGE